MNQHRRFILLSLFVLVSLTLNAAEKAGTFTANPAILLSSTGPVELELTFPEEVSLSELTLGNSSRTPLAYTCLSKSGGKKIRLRLQQVPDAPGDITVFRSGKPQNGLLKVIDKFRIALSFDDGPACGGDPEDGNIEKSPTSKTLRALAEFRHGPGNTEKGIAAIFFVLSTSDKFLHISWHKAECADGAALLQATSGAGHILGVHWGGEYGGQTIGHPARSKLPPYDSLGSGKAQGENALESDLLHCMNRIQQLTGQRPRYVRPPLWKYEDPGDSTSRDRVLGTYRKLGLKMILSDARYPDGGYALISLLVPNEMGRFRKNLQQAFFSGQRDIIISMHDSNEYTANLLPQILEEIKLEFARLSFGGVRAEAGQRLQFTQNAAQLSDLLDHKQSYSRFPEYHAD